MSNGAAKEYLQEILGRYHDGSRQLKKAILDEFCTVCGYHRKYSIRLLNDALRRHPKKVTSKRQKPGRPQKYNHPILLDLLTCIWRFMNLPCAKRLKAGLPLWLPSYTQYCGVQLPEKLLQLLATISASTIDRLLAPMRRKYKKLGLATTKPGSILKKHIPIKTNQWDENQPGFLEADTVAHCGASAAGMFVYTVNTVDIATGWTEQRALWGKGERGAFHAIQSIEQALPFSIKGFDCDNGSEFLNYYLLKYFTDRKQPVEFTRSRPYHKNDNAHVEEKNWTHIRQYLGYQRFDKPQMTDALNELYTTQWRLLFNFFIPSVKLVQKWRDRSKIIKKYDQPKTPLHRLLDSPTINPKTKQQLQNQFATCNPFVLQEQVKMKIKQLLTLLTTQPATEKDQ